MPELVGIFFSWVHVYLRMFISRSLVDSYCSKYKLVSSSNKRTRYDTQDAATYTGEEKNIHVELVLICSKTAPNLELLPHHG